MRARFFLLPMLILFCLMAPVLAQLDCPSLAAAAIDTLINNCQDLEANTVCYGSDAVDAQFIEDSPDVDFEAPGDRAFLSQFAELRAAPPSIEDAEWGIIALNANVPLDTSETAVTFLLFGDATLTYARIESLGEDAFGQAFHFSTALQSASCGETPASVTIQGEADARLTLNDSTLHFVSEGIIVLRQQSANSLVVTLLSGQIETFTQDADTPAATAQEGQTLAAVTDNDGNVILWSSARATTAQETQAAQIAREAFTRLAGGVFVAAPTATSAAPGTVSGVCEPIVYVVQRGDTVFRIALRYGSSVAAIANASGLSNPSLIHAGLELIIPCPRGAPQENAPTPVSNPPAATPAPAPPAPAPSACTSGITYTVQSGDTLYSIARRYGTTVEAVAAANNIVNIRLISVGQVLVIPCV
jgi:LysM repeat protein